MHYIIELFNHYGYIVLLIALMLELIAFPLPGEALMTYCGYTVSMNKMSWLISIIVAATGAIIGITIAYFIGKALGVNWEKYHSLVKKHLMIVSLIISVIIIIIYAYRTTSKRYKKGL